ncbi:glycosyltransferase [Roseivirga sp.]|uniref:glycosyltransferase n=1 Tax=Roseivirga sp. TaxID=1964215 RepID=UPI002B2763A4|nr:glycosyltransferase [Roseivirga sp.]
MLKRLKILFVRPALGYGGADRVTVNLLQAFDRDKFQCDLALMRAEGEFLDQIPEDVQLFDLKSKSLWSMWKPLKKLISESDYDVVYSTCGGASMPLMLAAWLGRFKGVTVVSERNILFPPKKSKAKRRLMILIKAFLYKKATWVTAVSQGVAIECSNILGVKSERIKVVYNPIVNKTLLEGARDEIKHPFFGQYDQTVLAVGRFEWQKDYDTLLRAFKKVAQVTDNVGLFILGKGPLESHLRTMVSDMEMEDKVCFAGFDTNPFKYMVAADVYVLSSQHEGMPGTLVQAMACGAACIATDCPTGPNELIIDGENGYLVEVADDAALAEKILSLLINNDLKSKFRNAAPIAVEQYSEKNGVVSYFNFLEK